MPPDAEARRAAFAQWVQRVLDAARIQRDWTPTDLLERTEGKLGRSTLYRWLRAEWETDPRPAQVVALCDAAEIPTKEAFQILWPGKSERNRPPSPLQLNPDLVELARRLNDPNTSDRERYMLREMLRSLAARGNRSSGAVSAEDENPSGNRFEIPPSTGSDSG